VVERYGKDAIEKVWATLPADVIQKITSFQPNVTPPIPPPQDATTGEPSTEDEPLKAHEVSGLADVLLTAVKMGGLEAMEDFEQLPETHKRQVWAVIPDDEKEIVRAAIQKPRQFSIENGEAL
jgi:hypothetical protein